MNMFTIRKATEEDLKTVNQWSLGWKMERLQDWWLPEENFIIDNIIFASLYKTDSKLAYMENVISNPTCPTEIRKIALGKLGPHIFDYCRQLGFKAVMGWTSNTSVAKTSEKHGMILTPYNHACMVKIL